jgi:hypothetical protein
MGTKSRTVDVALVAVIIGALGFIGYHFLLAPKTQDPGSTVLGPTEVAESPVLKLSNGTARPEHPQWLLEQVLPIETAQYLSLLSKYSGVLPSVDATSGCKAGLEPTPTISVLAPVVAERMKKGELQFLFGYKQPRCYMNSQKLIVLQYSSIDSEPFVRTLGEVTVESLVEYDPAQMPEEIIKSMGISREEYVDFVGYLRPQGLKDMLIKFGSLRPVETVDGVTPLGFPRAEVIRLNDIREVLAKVGNLRVLDVRSPEEFRAGHLKVSNVKNAPYTLPSGVPKLFSWNVLNRDLASSKFDPLSIGEGVAPVLIYGSSDKDPRPVYAMADLIRLGYRQIFWLREGYSAN